MNSDRVHIFIFLLISQCLMISNLSAETPVESKAEKLTPDQVDRIVSSAYGGISSDGIKYCLPCKSLYDDLIYSQRTVDDSRGKLASVNEMIKHWEETNANYKRTEGKENSDYEEEINQLKIKRNEYENQIDEAATETARLNEQLYYCLYTECYVVKETPFETIDDYNIKTDYSPTTHYGDSDVTIDKQTTVSDFYVSTNCAKCKTKVKEINNWVKKNYYSHYYQVPNDIEEGKTTKELEIILIHRRTEFAEIHLKLVQELKECEKKCSNKDKSHGSVLPSKQKIRYYAAAGATNLRTDDLKESIDAGKPLFAANGITGDFDSDTNDTGYTLAIGVEIPIDNSTFIDVNIFYTDGVELKGDVSGNAATIGGPFTFESQGKQEIKSFGIETSYMKRITNNIFLGGGLGYKYFEIEDSSDVVTTLNGAVTSNVSSGDKTYENVFSAQIEARVNLTNNLFINIEASRTLEEVGFNDEPISSISTFLGLRF